MTVSARPRHLTVLPAPAVPTEPQAPELEQVATTDVVGADLLLSGDPERWLAAARHHVDAALTQLGVDEDAVDDAVVMIDEVVANVVRHSLTGSAVVSVEPRRGCVTVVAREHGMNGHFDPSEHLTSSPVSTATSGRGLMILDRLALEWGVSRRHRATQVWFTVPRPEPTDGLWTVAPQAWRPGSRHRD